MTEQNILIASLLSHAWRTPLGDDADGVMDRLTGGACAAKPHQNIPPGAYACQLSAAIPGEPARSRNARFVRRIGLFAMEAGREAFTRSGIEPGERVGVFAGYGGLRVHWDEMMPALEHQQTDYAELWERGLRGMHPFWMLNHLSNNAHALLAAELGLKGVGLTLSGANAGAQALASAIEQLHAHTIDAALVFAYDTLILPNLLVEWGLRGDATTATSAHLAGPYDRRAAGVVPGEAACAVVLVRPDDGAANTLAWVSATEGADGSRVRPGHNAVRYALAALSAGVEVVDGDAAARPQPDAAERDVLAEFVEPNTPLISTSAAFGHVGAARSVLQVIALTRLLRGGVLPPIARLQTPAAGPLEPIVSPTRTQARIALGIHTGAPGLAGVIRVEIP